HLSLISSLFLGGKVFFHLRVHRGVAGARREKPQVGQFGGQTECSRKAHAADFARQGWADRPVAAKTFPNVVGKRPARTTSTIETNSNIRRNRSVVKTDQRE